MKEIQTADPRARRLTVLLLVCGTLAGLFVLWILESQQPAIEAWLTRDPEHMRERFRLFFGLLAAAFVLPGFGIAGYFWRLGNRIVRTDRFPPPGHAIIRDTVVLRGTPACRRGRALQVAAILMIVWGLAFAMLLWRLVSFLDPPTA